MDMLRNWWFNDLSRWVKFVFMALLVNALPAFIILMSLPGKTDTFFVWTINPEINARLVGVNYANALILIGIGILQSSWARVRIIMVVIMFFSILATVLTFFYIKPFLAHPWFHLAFWLTMYLILFFAAPIVFLTHEKKYGGRLPIQIPLTSSARLLAGVSMVISLISGLGLIFRIDLVNRFWPWNLPPLVGGLIGVLFISLTAAYAWSLWDGDWLRVRPMFWQAVPTGLLLMLLPIIHPAELNPNAGPTPVLYYILTVLVVLFNWGIILSYRKTMKNLPDHGF